LVSIESRTSKTMDIEDFKDVIGAGINVIGHIKKFVLNFAWLKLGVVDQASCS
jgi:hypothetical protein